MKTEPAPQAAPAENEPPAWAKALLATPKAEPPEDTVDLKREPLAPTPPSALRPRGFQLRMGGDVLDTAPTDFHNESAVPLQLLYTSVELWGGS